MSLPKFDSEKITIGSLIDTVADQFGSNKALEYPKLGISHDYLSFKNICNDVAKGFMALGIDGGEHVAIWANNVPQWVYTQFGTGKIGAVLVTVNTSYRSFELEYLLKQSDATTLLLIGGVRESDEYLNIIYDVCPELKSSEPGKLQSAKLPKLKNIIFLGEQKHPGMYNWDDIIKMGASVTDRELAARQASLCPDDAINMQYTSGTTGFPKGVMLSHRGIISNACSIGDSMNLSSEDSICIPVPLFHCFGCVLGTLTCLVSGATMVPVTAFNPDDVLETVEMCKCTALHGVPTMFFSELEAMKEKTYNLSSLRTGIVAGASVPHEMMKAVIDTMGIRELIIGYGQTEASPAITFTRTDDPLEVRVETVGQAIANVEVKIVDLVTEDLVPAGEQGEICTRGANVMIGYYKNADETAAVIDKEGWLHTGDLAVMDENKNYRADQRDDHPGGRKYLSQGNRRIFIYPP